MVLPQRPPRAPGREGEQRAARQDGEMVSGGSEAERRVMSNTGGGYMVWLDVGQVERTGGSTDKGMGGNEARREERGREERTRRGYGNTPRRRG